jgi:type IX secretion system PorP/SprF family membrane protein
MPRTKYILATLALLLYVGVVNSQQLPLYSQYMLNDFSMNPSIAGTQPEFEVKSDNRYQWVGITDAPRTYILTFDGPLTEKHIGIGSYVFTDITGPTRRTGFSLAYSYHMKLTDWLNLSLGLQTGILHFSVDGQQINLSEPGDPALASNLESVLVPDIGFGFYLYGKNFFLGAAAPQMVESQLKLTSFSDAQNIIATHYYATAGYKYAFSPNFSVEPMVVFKYVSPVPPQLDFSARVLYLNKYWLGAGFRTQDAIYALIGYTYQDNLTFGYSYDYSISDIRNYSYGTNEIFIGIKFNRNTSIIKSKAAANPSK